MALTPWVFSTPNPVVANSTLVIANHINELRNAINNTRSHVPGVGETPDHASSHGFGSTDPLVDSIFLSQNKYIGLPGAVFSGDSTNVVGHYSNNVWLGESGVWTRIDNDKGSGIISIGEDSILFRSMGVLSESPSTIMSLNLTTGLLTTSNIQSTSMTITGNASVLGTLSVNAITPSSGVFEVADLVASSINVAGDATIGDVLTAQTGVFNGDVTVHGRLIMAATDEEDDNLTADLCTVGHGMFNRLTVTPDASAPQQEQISIFRAYGDSTRQLSIVPGYNDVNTFRIAATRTVDLFGTTTNYATKLIFDAGNIHLLYSAGSRNLFIGQNANNTGVLVDVDGDVGVYDRDESRGLIRFRPVNQSDEGQIGIDFKMPLVIKGKRAQTQLSTSDNRIVEVYDKLTVGNGYNNNYWKNEGSDGVVGEVELYVVGSGYNLVPIPNRVLTVGGTTIYNTGQHSESNRGLRLTILNGTTFAVVHDQNYDTYGDPAQSNSLATRLNAITSGQIGVLSTFNAWEMSATSNLRTAFYNMKLLEAYNATATTSVARRPYVAVFTRNKVKEVIKPNTSDQTAASIRCFLDTNDFSLYDWRNAESTARVWIPYGPAISGNATEGRSGDGYLMCGLALSNNIIMDNQSIQARYKKPVYESGSSIHSDYADWRYSNLHLNPYGGHAVFFSSTSLPYHQPQSKLQVYGAIGISNSTSQCYSWDVGTCKGTFISPQTLPAGMPAQAPVSGNRCRVGVLQFDISKDLGRAIVDIDAVAHPGATVSGDFGGMSSHKIYFIRKGNSVVTYSKELWGSGITAYGVQGSITGRCFVVLIGWLNTNFTASATIRGNDVIDPKWVQTV